MQSLKIAIYCGFISLHFRMRSGSYDLNVSKTNVVLTFNVAHISKFDYSRYGCFFLYSEYTKHILTRAFCYSNADLYFTCFQLNSTLDDLDLFLLSCFYFSINHSLFSIFFPFYLLCLPMYKMLHSNNSMNFNFQKHSVVLELIKLSIEFHFVNS